MGKKHLLCEELVIYTRDGDSNPQFIYIQLIQSIPSTNDLVSLQVISILQWHNLSFYLVKVAWLIVKNNKQFRSACAHLIRVVSVFTGSP